MVYSLRAKKTVDYNVAKVLQKACREIHAARHNKRAQGAKYKTYCKRLQKQKKMKKVGLTKSQDTLLKTMKKELNQMFGSRSIVTIENFEHDFNRVFTDCFEHSKRTWNRFNLKFNEFDSGDLSALPIEAKIEFIRRTVNINKTLC